VTVEDLEQVEELHARGRLSARATLLNAFGDLIYPSADPVPTALVLTVLRDAGVEDHAGRQALARASRSSWLTGERRGREMWWSVSDHGRELIRDGHRRIDTLSDDLPPWQGQWVVLLVSIPHERRAVRERLHRYLTWSSFGSPAGGVWVCPYPERESGARFAIDRFALRDTTLSFTGSSGTIGLDDREIVERAWRLPSLQAHYQDLVRRHGAVEPRTGSEAVRALLDLDGELQRLPLIDPQLPEELAPGSVTRESAKILMGHKQRWRAQARDYVDGLRR
jgi:phenylacetic acid degradation operon negative regulatory protein